MLHVTELLSNIVLITVARRTLAQLFRKLALPFSCYFFLYLCYSALALLGVDLQTMDGKHSYPSRSLFNEVWWVELSHSIQKQLCEVHHPDDEFAQQWQLPQNTVYCWIILREDGDEAHVISPFAIGADVIWGTWETVHEDLCLSCFGSTQPVPLWKQ